MGLNAFLSFMLMLTVGWMQIYSQTRERYNGVAEYKHKAKSIEEKLNRARLASIVEREHFLEFRQQVAALMPEVLEQKGLGQEGYGVRNLASVVTSVDSGEIRKTIARTLFENGKENFRKGNFQKSTQAFGALIDRYGYTTYVPESFFLMAEGLFQDRKLEECTDKINQMLELYPSHELTGFALIRLGKIYEIQKRSDEAVEIYKTVMKSFTQADVINQARISLKQVEL